MNIPRMRTIQELVKEIKQLDNDTQITVSAIRRLVRENKIKSVSIGNKTLINLDYCIDYLNNPQASDEHEDKNQKKSTELIDTDRMAEYKKNIELKK